MVTESLQQTEITGNDDVDGIQRTLGDTIGDTVGANGLAGGVGEVLDKGVLKGNV